VNPTNKQEKTSAKNQNQQSRSQKIQSDRPRQGQKKQRVQEPFAFEQRKEAKTKITAVYLSIGG